MNGIFLHYSVQIRYCNYYVTASNESLNGVLLCDIVDFISYKS